MEGTLSATDQQSMVSSFLEIAVGQTAETARQFLQATSWKLEEAIQLFYIGSDGGGPVVGSSSQTPSTENFDALAEQTSRMIRPSDAETEIGNENMGQLDGDEVRPPLPVIREALYDDPLMVDRVLRMRHPSVDSGSLIAFRNFDEEMKHPGVWESDQGVASTADNSRDNLASLYRPPFHLMFHGSFEKAKGTASLQDKWLLVNLQSTKEFSSHMLNRDTWANEAVSQTISTNFIFWQVYDDTTEGQKVCTYYKLDSIPVVLVIDPITGQKMRSWKGMVQAERLLEDLLPFMDGGPKDHHVTLSHKRPRESSLAQPQKTKGNRLTDALIVADKTNEEDEEVLRALAASMESIKESNKVESKDKDVNLTDEDENTFSDKKPNYPPLPEEPKGDKSLLCRVGVRLPDGRRVQRSFLRTDPIQLLWSFCCSLLKEAETRPFRLTQAIPGASKCLDFDSQTTFGESGLANSMISVTWE
ncbi:UBX domain-containing protein [Trema orientale]|uniref:UBX domain-containing protein n=1 Tax=Trema orientale TaxID=63057 RepID=A0A2P5E9E4_TREOI|nr:UBX domain-containing protein [Trema orientale]